MGDRVVGFSQCLCATCVLFGSGTFCPWNNRSHGPLTHSWERLGPSYVLCCPLPSAGLLSSIALLLEGMDHPDMDCGTGIPTALRGAAMSSNATLSEQVINQLRTSVELALTLDPIPRENFCGSRPFFWCE